MVICWNKKSSIRRKGDNKMGKRTYQYLLFDLDNTLFDFNKAECQAFQKVCEKYEIDYGRELFEFYHQMNDALWKSLESGEINQKELQSKRFEEVCRYVGKRQVCYEKMNADYRLFLSRCSEMIPGALEVCQKLAHSFSIYLVTNGVSKTQRNRLKGSKLMDYVSDVFISEEIGFHKPQKEFFEYVLSHIGSEKSEALVIGDSITSDILGGKQAGIPTCLYDPTGKGHPKDIVPDFTICDLSELLDIL